MRSCATDDVHNSHNPDPYPRLFLILPTSQSTFINRVSSSTLQKNNKMSWWWKSSKGPSATSTTSELGIPLTNGPNSHPAAALEPTPAPVSEPVNSSLSRDEQTNQEFIAWLKEAEADLTAKREVKEGTRAPSKAYPARGDAVDDISPDSLYPTEISCRSAFDYAFFCQSFGGQFVNVYRYGGFRKCSNHWEDFWLCMRTRNWEESDRKRAIKDHYRKKAVKYKQGPSSEDVWSVRTEPVRDAFQGDLEKMEADIREWKASNPGMSNELSSSRGVKVLTRTRRAATSAI